LAGFKSFVDPTTVSVPANLIGVVGPNGCGKSNVIDAVRWVMGESSAKTLRGDQMADVIFNGSTARKPVGKAAVELVFDNSEGTAPGAYAKYAEIAVRRELSRDGQSSYFINKIRCRRRDITDIFLGTGLGPRSYSIIEQGMVSRIIEARPEDLRNLIEEAAGVSKYKDRRRETETRIRHTKENLDRVNDIRNELETQLRRLKRQSSAAARYRVLKQEERLLRAQLMSLRWRSLDSLLKNKDLELAEQEKAMDARLAEQRGIEAEIERLRSAQTESNESLNAVQGEFYGIGADIASVEQSIEHLRESREQRRGELERLAGSIRETDSLIEADKTRIAELETRLAAMEPTLQTVTAESSAATGILESLEQAYQAWQATWEAFAREASQPEREGDVQRTRIEELERQVANLNDRRERLERSAADVSSSLESEELTSLREEVAEQDELCEALEQEIEDLELRIQGKRGEIMELTDALQEQRDQHQNMSGRLASLQELQDAALGAHDQALADWLKENGLDSAPRLNSELEVEPGWERAVDRVLGNRVSSVCVSDLDRVAAGKRPVLSSDVYLVEKSATSGSRPAGRASLRDKVRCASVDLGNWIDRVFVAEDIDAALAERASLRGDESIIVADGTWVGRHWIALAGSEGARAGMLAREGEIARLRKAVQTVDAEVSTLKHKTDKAQEQLFSLEEESADKRRSLNRYAQNRALLHNRHGRAEERLKEMKARHDRLQLEVTEIAQQIRQTNAAMGQAREKLQGVERDTLTVRDQRSALVGERDRLKKELAQARERADSVREQRHRAEFEQQRIQTSLDGLRENNARMVQQHRSMQDRRGELETLLHEKDNPEERLQGQLADLLQKRVAVESRLKSARLQVSEFDESIRNREGARHELEQGVQELRDQRDNLRIERQELLVRRDTMADQIRDLEGEKKEPAELIKELPEDAAEPAWQEKLDTVLRRIDRIGPVNLVAIEEYEEQSERKTYLDKQYADLTEALATLEAVIQKIDRETRTRFKETFDQLNSRFQEFFPRLFGGGSAYIEMTGTDLLDTGVSVMARPPGKRNSTIHLLSGGEKALTAVALLFSFFDLNPAPFCMLDEVDAPLDDANVERYCEVLKTLGGKTQLIFITHNKITMEAADILVGVTMGEPGVSRLVAVDVDEAIQMAVQ